MKIKGQVLSITQRCSRCKQEGYPEEIQWEVTMGTQIGDIVLKSFPSMMMAKSNTDFAAWAASLEAGQWVEIDFHGERV